MAATALPVRAGSPVDAAENAVDLIIAGDFIALREGICAEKRAELVDIVDLPGVLDPAGTYPTDLRDTVSVVLLAASGQELALDVDRASVNIKLSLAIDMNAIEQRRIVTARMTGDGEVDSFEVDAEVARMARALPRQFFVDVDVDMVRDDGGWAICGTSSGLTPECRSFRGSLIRSLPMTTSTDIEAPAALEADHVHHRYGRRAPWALQDVSLSVPEGAIVALVGPNGAGKSTLMRSWLGFERPGRGSLAVHGRDVRSDHRAATRQLGYLSQSGGLFPHLSVGAHLSLASTLRREFDPDLAQARLDDLRIQLDRRAAALSGGQQKHVELAIALGTRAPVLILDEPLNALDALARSEFLRVLSDEVKATGRTVLLSSHIIRDIEMVCDRIIILAEGRVGLDDTVEDALRRHRLADRWSGQAVAPLQRPGGAVQYLVESSDADLAVPSLEDLVMGYLVQSRASAGRGEPGTRS